MRPPTRGQERVALGQHMVCGQPQSVDPTPPVQGPLAQLPSRSRGMVLPFEYAILLPDLAAQRQVMEKRLARSQQECVARLRMLAERIAATIEVDGVREVTP